ncbi:MAG: carnitine-CoA ligase [Pseudonocardiales bacterium]|nr:carnitine-CoA ligase [Pseudonocardiales bacterium]
MYRTIPQLLSDAAARDSDGIWIRTEDSELTFAAACTAVGARVAALRAYGVRRGDLVALTARTTPPYLLAWLAIASMGAIAVPMNPASTAAELAGLLAQTHPRALITDGALRPTVEAADALVLDVDDLAGGAATLPTDAVSADDVACLIPTSGTTGRSKLVAQTHRAYVMAGEGFPYWMELSSADRLMTSLPLFHINAQAYSTLGSLACGAGLVLLPRFSASGFLDAARRHGATEFNAIGAMLEILMRQPERPDDADNPLRLCYTGPAPERERQLEIEARFGVRIVVGYAMSESPYGLIWPHGQRPYGTLGTVRQHPVLGVVNEARVVDDEEADTDHGELLLRSPAVTPGYWGMPDETAQAIDADGWLRTGDIVTRDNEGVFTFVTRKKEVLRRRGENLSPIEVEEALAGHPSVVECAVVGVPSELSEDEVKAFVVTTGPADFTALREWAAERLAAFKVPRYWQQVAALPRTPTQRVAKHQLPTGHPAGEFDAEEGSAP